MLNGSMYLLKWLLYDPAKTCLKTPPNSHHPNQWHGR